MNDRLNVEVKTDKSACAKMGLYVLFLKKKKIQMIKQSMNKVSRVDFILD